MVSPIHPYGQVSLLLIRIGNAKVRHPLPDSASGRHGAAGDARLPREDDEGDQVVCIRNLTIFGATEGGAATAFKGARAVNDGVYRGSPFGEGGTTGRRVRCASAGVPGILTRWLEGAV